MKYIEDELTRREWSRSDLARKSRLTNAQISRVLNGEQKAGQVFCEGIARAFEVPLDSIYRYAGLLPKKPTRDEREERVLYLFRQIESENGREMAEKVLEALTKSGSGKKRLTKSRGIQLSED